MSFLKRLLKTTERRKSKGQKGETEGVRSRSASCSSDRSNSPSPAPSPRHRSASSTSGVHSPTVTTVHFRSPTNRNIAQVLPGLLLGTQEIAQDLNALERYKVTHILNVTEEVNCSYPDRFAYKRISIPDRPSTNIAQYFGECFDYIDDVRKNQSGCVLVHCYYGESRSASIVIGYLIKTEGMRHREALEYLQLLRPGVQPNTGFAKQIDEFELETGKRSIHR